MKKSLKSQSGFAMLESVVFMTSFIILTAYTIDFFTSIHTGIVNSIGARTYLFETLEHRSNIYWLRESAKDLPSYNFANETNGYHERFHTVVDEAQVDNDGTHAAGRVITLPQMSNPMRAPGGVSSLPGLDNQKNQTTTIYIKSGYGICLDADCKGG